MILGAMETCSLKRAAEYYVQAFGINPEVQGESMGAETAPSLLKLVQSHRDGSRNGKNGLAWQLGRLAKGHKVDIMVTVPDKDSDAHDNNMIMMQRSVRLATLGAMKRSRG